MIAKTFRKILFGVLVMVLLPIGSAYPAEGRTIQTCSTGTDCTAALAAVCDPTLASAPCAHPADPTLGPKSVTIQLHGWGGAFTVHVWWLKGEINDETKTDCTQALATGRTFISDVTTNASGDGSVNVTLPPGNSTGDWVYGANWVCATTASLGNVGNWANQPFLVG